jgi:hypothetical protein
MSNPAYDPETAAALDRFTVPALPRDFADRLVAAATAPQHVLPARVEPRRNRRGSWLRGPRVIVGAALLGLMSTAVAATAIFGDVARDVPVIGPIIARVVPAKPHATLKPVRKAPPAQGEAQARLASPPVAAVPERQTIRREVMAQRIADRIERRAERRQALGLPPRPIRPAQAVRVLKRIPPEDRAAVVERVIDIRREQRGLPPLTDEQKARRLERWQQRRAWRQAQIRDAAPSRTGDPQP